MMIWRIEQIFLILYASIFSPFSNSLNKVLKIFKNKCNCYINFKIIYDTFAYFEKKEVRDLENTPKNSYIKQVIKMIPVFDTKLCSVVNIILLIRSRMYQTSMLLDKLLNWYINLQLANGKVKYSTWYIIVSVLLYHYCIILEVGGGGQNCIKGRTL